ncbi:hypothetical protein [Phenylobacterium sp.]|jgi:hypothetical protein|uniref:hypothetical protein n=1 Tax=Phenylobacterium sp. TaxID=1871053 RepID=UPI002E366969|nr:hypothetical protein [Phenylobacterium sp.]HEX3363572.1 hypothetical protein [Phenylobacterium sp.]
MTRTGAFASAPLVAAALALIATFGAQARNAPDQPASNAGAQAAAAQASSTVETLTVVAPKVEQEKLPDLVNRFVEAHSATSRIDQLSRWAGPVCPQTGGLTAPFDAYVTARVKAVAASVGAPVDKHPNRNFPCKTNLLIVFTTTPQTLMDDVRKHHPQMLGFHYAAQAQRLATVNQPIQAWYMTGTAPEGGNVETDDEFHRLPNGSAGSRLTSRISSQFMGVLVVIDASKIVGHQIGAIADSAAMLSLAHASQVKGCSELPTILDFLNPDCPAGADPPGLSRYDVAYLKGLYSIDPREHLSAQRSEIGSRILREAAAP